jgi:hypothetical protein
VVELLALVPAALLLLACGWLKATAVGHDVAMRARHSTEFLPVDLSTTWWLDGGQR